MLSQVMVGIGQAAVDVSNQRAERLSRADFDRVVQHYQGALVRFLYGLVHDPELAADLCQDTFVSAFRAAPRLEGEVNLSAWLYTIALNHARAYLRRKRLLSWVPFVVGRHDRPALTADLATRAAQRDELRELLRKLPIEQRACLLLHADGFRYAEIAQILECSVAAVKVRIFRARARCLELSHTDMQEDT